jgi:hypothetical protein
MLSVSHFNLVKIKSAIASFVPCMGQGTSAENVFAFASGDEIANSSVTAWRSR